MDRVRKESIWVQKKSTEKINRKKYRNTKPFLFMISDSKFVSTLDTKIRILSAKMNGDTINYHDTMDRVSGERTKSPGIEKRTGNGGMGNIQKRLAEKLHQMEIECNNHFAMQVHTESNARGSFYGTRQSQQHIASFGSGGLPSVSSIKKNLNDEGIRLIDATKHSGKLDSFANKEKGVNGTKKACVPRKLNQFGKKTTSSHALDSDRGKYIGSLVSHVNEAIDKVDQTKGKPIFDLLECSIADIAPCTSSNSAPIEILPLPILKYVFDHLELTDVQKRTFSNLFLDPLAQSLYITIFWYFFCLYFQRGQDAEDAQNQLIIGCSELFNAFTRKVQNYCTFKNAIANVSVSAMQSAVDEFFRVCLFDLIYCI